MSRYATDTYAFNGLPYAFRSGTQVLLAGRVEVECGRIPDTIMIEVTDAVEPDITYSAHVSLGHPLHRHVREHVTKVDSRPS